MLGSSLMEGDCILSMFPFEGSEAGAIAARTILSRNNENCERRSE